MASSKAFKKTIGIPDIDDSKKDYTYWWQLWHHNWDDKDIEAIEEFCPLDGKKILEVGCGDGRISFTLADKCKSIVGADLSEPLIAAANSRLNLDKHKNVKFELMDAQKLKMLDESFDAVLFPWVLQMVNDPLQAVQEAHRVLNENGKVVVIALLDADYDDIIRNFVPSTSNIDVERIYEKPLSQIFGSEICATKVKRNFQYFFENIGIASEAFKYALDQWYGGIKLDEEGERLLIEVLKNYQVGERICLEFPAFIYAGQK